MNYLCTSKSRAGSWHRISTNGDGRLCTSSDNDLRLERLDSSSNRLRASATVKRFSPPSSYGG
jgi:hypothetical protein